MQLNALQEQVERVIPTWCAENGFGLDPVTVSTFTELAIRLLAALPDGLAQGKVGLSATPGPHLSDTDLLTDTTAEGFDTRNLLFPYAKGEDLGARTKKLAGAADSVKSLKPEAATMAYGQSPSSGLFSDVSGDWRTLFHDDDWWAVGHHMIYPARNEDDARRLCNELRNQN